MVNTLKYIFIGLVFMLDLAWASVPVKMMKSLDYQFEELLIQGTSNINSFQMSYREDRETSVVIPEQSLSLAISALKIESDSPGMRNDFLHLIRADRYPQISICLAADAQTLVSGEMNEQLPVTVTMNGIASKYVCMPVVNRCSDGKYRLSGKLKMNLSDFGIDPPKKILGLIRVRNEVFVSFRVLFFAK